MEERRLFDVTFSRTVAVIGNEEDARVMALELMDCRDMDMPCDSCREIISPEGFKMAVTVVREAYKAPHAAYEWIEPLMRNMLRVAGYDLTKEDASEIYTWCERLMDLDD